MTEQLEPGRELDALIAEKVMGWTCVTFKEGKHWARGVPIGSLPTIPVADWSPSTDWLAAGEVIEKLGGLSLMHLAAGETWDATFGAQRMDAASLWRTAKTGPHAICLAALAASEKK